MSTTITYWRGWEQDIPSYGHFSRPSLFQGSFSPSPCIALLFRHVLVVTVLGALTSSLVSLSPFSLHGSGSGSGIFVFCVLFTGVFGLPCGECLIRLWVLYLWSWVSLHPGGSPGYPAGVLCLLFLLTISRTECVLPAYSISVFSFGVACYCSSLFCPLRLCF